MKRIICFFLGHRAWKVDIDCSPVLEVTNDARTASYGVYICGRCDSLYCVRVPLTPGKPVLKAVSK